jgi:hypothetical protein
MSSSDGFDYTLLIICFLCIFWVLFYTAKFTWEIREKMDKLIELVSEKT